MKSFHKIFIAYLIFAVVIGTFGWLPNIAKAYTTVSEWKLDGSYVDSVGTHNGTANGTTISVANNYLSLTAAGEDKVTMGDADAFSFTSGADSDEPFSVAAWVKVNSAGDGVVILSKVNNDAGLEYDFVLKGGFLRLALYDDSGLYTNVMYQETQMTTYPSIKYIDTWVHVAATYDGNEASASGIKLYMNGSLLVSNPTKVNYSGMANTTAPLVIGNRYINTSQIYSDGALDAVKLMSTELTPTEVGSIFNSEANNYRAVTIQSNFFEDGLVSHIASLDTLVPYTQVIFTPVQEINDNDGILLSFGTGITLGTFDGSELQLDQINDGGAIAKGTVDKSGQNVRIIVATAGDLKAEKVTINIASQVTTPSSAGTYTVTASVYDLGTDNAWGGAGGAADTLESQGTSAAVFGDFNVEISASVDPTLTLTLDTWYGEPPTNPISENDAPGTCVLGVLSSTENRLCLYQATVDTNSTGGYTAFVRDMGNFASGANEMADSTGTLSPGTEGYGIATSASGYQIAQINDFDGGGIGLTDIGWLWGHRTQTSVNATAVTTNDQSFGGATGPVDNNQTVLMHMVDISGVTKAGTYTTTTIITVVGNF